MLCTWEWAKGCGERRGRPEEEGFGKSRFLKPILSHCLHVQAPEFPSSCCCATRSLAGEIPDLSAELQGCDSLQPG